MSLNGRKNYLWDCFRVLLFLSTSPLTLPSPHMGRGIKKREDIGEN